MTPVSARERSGSELVFGLLRTLMIGYQLWGVGSELELGELPAALRTSGAGVGSAVRFLASEGLVEVDEMTSTIRLSNSGAQRLLGLFDT
jgi:hypothetical protein